MANAIKMAIALINAMENKTIIKRQLYAIKKEGITSKMSGVNPIL